MPCEVAVVARVFTPNGKKKDCRSTCKVIARVRPWQAHVWYSQPQTGLHSMQSGPRCESHIQHPDTAE